MHHGKTIDAPAARNCRTTVHDPGFGVNTSNGPLWSEVCRFYGKYLLYFKEQQQWNRRAGLFNNGI